MTSVSGLKGLIKKRRRRNLGQIFQQRGSVFRTQYSFTSHHKDGAGVAWRSYCTSCFFFFFGSACACAPRPHCPLPLPHSSRKTSRRRYLATPLRWGMEKNKKNCFIVSLPFTAAVSRSPPPREERTAFSHFTFILLAPPSLSLFLPVQALNCMCTSDEARLICAV